MAIVKSNNLNINFVYLFFTKKWAFMSRALLMASLRLVVSISPLLLIPQLDFRWRL